MAIAYAAYPVGLLDPDIFAPLFRLYSASARPETPNRQQPPSSSTRKASVGRGVVLPKASSQVGGLTAIDFAGLDA